MPTSPITDFATAANRHLDDVRAIVRYVRISRTSSGLSAWQAHQLFVRSRDLAQSLADAPDIYIPSLAQGKNIHLQTWAIHAYQYALKVIHKFNTEVVGTVSLDAPSQEQETGDDWANTVAPSPDEPETDVLRDLGIEWVQRQLRFMPARQRYVLEHSFGLNDRDQWPDRAIAEQIGVSRVRAGQIRREAIRVLQRRALESEHRGVLDLVMDEEAMAV